MSYAIAIALLVAGQAAGTAVPVSGEYFFGHEVESFRPCGSGKSYWVAGAEATLQPLRDRAERLRLQRGKPYQPVYLEAVGGLDTKSKREGFAASYDGLFYLDKIAGVSDNVPGTCARRGKKAA
ncbi:hypothetical protein D3C83_14980 [compost metagenome]